MARQTGNPGAISGALAVLALVLVGTEPEQSRALIAESIELNDALGDIVVDENALVVAFLVSALLGERDQALRLTARGLDRGFSMLVSYCACLEATAQTLAPEQPDVAATLHGTIDELVPSLVHAEPYRALRKRATRSHQHPTRRGARQRAARTRRRNDRGPSHRVRARCHRARAQ